MYKDWALEQDHNPLDESVQGILYSHRRVGERASFQRKSVAVGVLERAAGLI